MYLLSTEGVVMNGALFSGPEVGSLLFGASPGLASYFSVLKEP